MIKCKKCGNENEGNLKECASCSAELSTENYGFNLVSGNSEYALNDYMPDTLEALIIKASMLQERSRFEESLSYIARGISINNNHPDLWFLNGNAIDGLYPEIPSSGGSEVYLKLEESIRCYEECIRLSPEFSLAYFHKALVQEKLGKHSDAMNSYRQFIQSYPGQELTPQINHAEIRLEKNEVVAVPPVSNNPQEQTMTWLEKLAHGDQDDANVFLEMVEELKLDNKKQSKNKDYACSSKTVIKDIPILDNNLETKKKPGFFEKISSFLTGNKTISAQKSTVKTSLSKTDMNPVSKPLEDNFHDIKASDDAVRQGLSEYRQNNYAKALENFKRAVVLNPVNSNALTNCGICLTDLNKENEALDYHRKAVEIDSENFKALNNYADALCNSGKYEEAIKYFEKALLIKSDEPYLWSNKGTCLIFLERYEDALQCFEKALSMNPGDSPSTTNMGVALSRLGRYYEAIEYNERNIKMNPDNIKAWYNKGCNLGNLNLYYEAIEAYDKALSIQPQYKEAMNNKAEALLYIGKPEESILLFNELISLSPAFANAWEGISEAYISVGRFSEALSSAEKALELNPESLTAIFFLAIAMEALNQKGKALEAFRKFISTAKVKNSKDEQRLIEAKNRLSNLEESLEESIEEHRIDNSQKIKELISDETKEFRENADIPESENESEETSFEEESVIYDDSEMLISTPLPRKVINGSFTQTGIIFQTADQQSEIPISSIQFMYLGKIEPDAEDKERGKSGPLGPSQKPMKPGGKAGRFQAKVISSPYYLIDIFASGSNSPYRIDPVGTNLKGFLGEQAGFSAEINMFNFVRKFVAMIPGKADVTIINFMEKGKKEINIHSSRDGYSTASFLAFRKRSK